MSLTLGRRALRLERATWLSDSLLLLQGQGRPASGTSTARAAFQDRVLELDAHLFSYNERGRLRRKAHQLVMLRFPSGARAAGQPSLDLELAGKRLSLEASKLEPALTDVSTLLREELVGLERAVREEVLDFILTGALPGLREPGAFTLSKRLRTIREALREPLSESMVRHEEAQVVNVEWIMALGDDAFWISGWTRDEDGTFTDLVAVSPEGQRAPLGDAFRAVRRDVEAVWRGSGLEKDQKHGFMQFFELPAPSPLQKGWIVELRNQRGEGVETDAPDIRRDVTDVRETLFKEFGVERPNREEFRIKHLNPALLRLQNQVREAEQIETVVEYGAGNDAPTVSIVVTLYQRLDLLNHQLLSFAQDPAMRDTELIYVLDSPELAGPLSDLASTLYALHRIPFRILKLARSAGFSNANNLGTSLAQGRLLLLVNSDVFPEHPGWLERMASFYDATSNIGALGPKLLYEDDSIQHAGMYFEREAGTSVWRNQHYFKGLHRSFPPANVSRPVPAVTGACLMIDRLLYQELGGFRDIYVHGGYEDSDLCLRLLDKGLKNWYVSEVELYHLEAQSYPTDLRSAVTGYNSWLQTHLWDEFILRLMQDLESASSTEHRMRAPDPEPEDASMEALIENEAVAAEVTVPPVS
jgi:GT2 family glycosyltransferase